ncbi:MAG: serine/threonine-protein kinase [Austwickia sp.]|nr:serine/threonine-protein kinase [Actinomycetota bacterium]MCO5309566.1 serine/threonine-protein kinase [Austwickia sp.]
MSIETGAVYGNRYTLLDRIAYGGMGEVWKASDKVLGRTVAIKLLSPNLAEQPGFVERFREEARHTALLGHPNIATVYDYGKEDGGAAGTSWLVMEYVEGEPLSQIIRSEGPQSPRRTAMIIGQCADALQAAHEAGVVHRDVKPANILVRPDGVVKLTDFGIARAKDASPLTRTGEVMGTAQYISPEQAMGKEVTGKSDIYSLGVVAYELLTGTRPFDEGAPFATAMAHVHKPAPALPASVPSAMATVVASCLAKDPAQRPVSAAALAAAMRGGPAAAAAAVSAGFNPTQVLASGPAATTALTDATAYARPPAPTGPANPAYRQPDQQRRTNPWLWAAFAVLALLALFAILRMTGVIGSDAPPPTPSSTPPTTSRTTTTSSSSTSTTTTTRTADSIDPTIYVGSPRTNVKAALEKLGYTKFTYDMVDNDKPAGTVLAVNPSGVVPFDQPITLKISNGPPQTTTQAPPSPSPTPTQPSTPAPQPTSPRT